MNNYDIIVENQHFSGNPSLAPPDKFQPSGKRDLNALGFSWRPGQKKKSILIKNCIIDANGVAEGLKLSYAHDVLVEKCKIIGGYEDCVDIVRGGRIVFNQCRFIAKNTKHHFTIKCMVDDVVISNCTFVNAFNNLFDGALVDIGNWGTYNYKNNELTKNIKIIDCKLECIPWWKQILTRTIHGESPTIINTKGFNFKIPKFLVNLFFKYKIAKIKNNP